MKRLSILFLFGALAVAGSAAATGPYSAVAPATGPQSLNDFKSGVLPVYVQVNSSGKVTRVSSAIQLSPHYDRLLRENIRELITGPAMRHNKGVSSSVVLNMVLKTTPRTDGSYDAQFAYLSSKPVPAGLSHWAWTDGHELALVRDADTFQSRHWNTDNERNRMSTQPTYYSDRSSTKSARSTSSTASPTQGSSKGR